MQMPSRRSTVVGARAKPGRNRARIVQGMEQKEGQRDGETDASGWEGPREGLREGSRDAERDGDTKGTGPAAQRDVAGSFQELECTRV